MSYLLSLFAEHAYLILFLGIFLELMALPISGELLMSYAGYFAYQGQISYLLALLIVLVAGGTGCLLTYWIGKAGGYRLIEKYGRYIHLGPERYEKVSSWFERSGSKLIVFAYFIPGVRHFTGYVSGISRLPLRKFIIPSYIGAFLWGACFVTLGKVLGPKWKVFHEAAGKYMVMLLILLVCLIAAFVIYRFYRKQIKNLLSRFLQRIRSKVKHLRAAELMLIGLTLALIGWISLMLGLAQDYLFDDFSEFDSVTTYVVQKAFDLPGVHAFLISQSPILAAGVAVITFISIWIKKRNRLLEYMLLVASTGGVWLFHDVIRDCFSVLQTFGFARNFHSADFPDAQAMQVIAIYGACCYLLVRHVRQRAAQLFVPFFGLVLLVGMAVSRIATTSVLPSDIAGGYVYGGVWIFFNFMLFEMLRLILSEGAADKQLQKRIEAD